MKVSFSIVAGGFLSLLIGGALVYEGTSGGMTPRFSLYGMAVALFGVFTIFFGFLMYALRNPTTEELASQDPDEPRTWQFRKTGLLLVVVFVVIGIALQKSVERYFPDIAAINVRVRHVSAPVHVFVYALLVVSLFSFRVFRNLVFFAGPSRAAGVATDKLDEAIVNRAEASRSLTDVLPTADQAQGQIGHDPPATES